MKKYYDISPEISAELAVFEGDVPFSRQIHYDMKTGEHITLSSIQTSLHLGAHVDAPNHYKKEGVGIGERDLSFYRGPAQVVRLPAKPRQCLTSNDFENIKIITERVLIYTGTFLNPNRWRDDFAALSADLIDWLSEKHGVRLVGIDTPSIDLSDSKDLATHAAIARHDMAILEGVVLESVPEGVYELIALPLRLREADASPVRAVLYEI